MNKLDLCDHTIKNRNLVKRILENQQKNKNNIKTGRK